LSVGPRRALGVPLAAALGCAALTLGCGSSDPQASSCASPEPEGRPPECWRPYGPESPFNRMVPEAPPLLPRSAQVIERLRSWGPPQDILLGVADTDEDFGHPLYFSGPSDPDYRVRCLRWRPCEIEGQIVRIPEAARPAAGGDGHMAVIDIESGWEYDFWQVRHKPEGGGTLVVSHGGRTRIGGGGLGSNATAAHFGLAAGIVRPHELLSGRIPHALFVAVRCSDGTSVHPAQPGTEAANCSRFGEPDRHAPPLGARLWLDMSRREIGDLPVPRWKRGILHALHRYGGLVGDTLNGNSSFGLLLESGSSETSFDRPDPWLEVARETGADPWNGKYLLTLDDDTGWRSRLRVLAPCVSSGTC
jgi:hypothetical protein